MEGYLWLHTLKASLKWTLENEGEKIYQGFTKEGEFYHLPKHIQQVIIMSAKLNLTDKRFTRLLALSEVGIDAHGQVQWLCQCDCGNQIVVTAVRLRSGNVKSCGCLKRDIARCRQKNATAAVICDGTSKNILSQVTHSNTGIRGVSYNKVSHKYEAKLMCQGKIRFRGYFEKLDDAVAARKAAEQKWIKPLVDNWDSK